MADTKFNLDEHPYSHHDDHPIPEQPKDTKSPLFWLWKLAPWTWPTWLKFLAAGPVITLLAFYFRDVRVGDGFWGKPGVEIEAGVRLKVDNYSRVTIDYAQGQTFPADGLFMTVVTQDDHAKTPERLAPFIALVKDDDWPIVVFVNGTGFDTTGEPICIRRASDGKELYRSDNSQRVALCVGKSDGSFTVYLPSGGSRDLSEKDWVEKFMRLTLQSPETPKDLEKLSDEELKKLGYERIPLEEAKKRGLVNEKPETPKRITIHDLNKDKDKK